MNARRALALALIGGAAYAGWRFYRAGGLGGAPSAGASLSVIEAFQPGELGAELDSERAALTIGGIFDSGWRLGDPHAGAAVLAQIPVAALARQVAALADEGRATLDRGIRTTGSTTGADRRVIAEAECRRASNVAGLPSWLIDDCARELGVANRYRYRPANGSRLELGVEIGHGGLPGYAPTAPSSTPDVGRSRPPTA